MSSGLSISRKKQPKAISKTPANSTFTYISQTQAPLISAESSRRHKATSNLHPLGNTAALFALDVDNIRVTPAPAAHAVFLLRVPLRPVIIVFFEEFLVIAVACGALLLKVGSEVGFTWQLASRSVGGTVLDCCVAVAEVTEVVDVGG
jgi:hypothetical protein